MIIPYFKAHNKVVVNLGLTWTQAILNWDVEFSRRSQTLSCGPLTESGGGDPRHLPSIYSGLPRATASNGCSLKKSCKNDCLLLLGRRWFEGLECQPWHTFEKHLLFFSKHLFTLDMILCSITIVSQCLKITFNIASEANYVYILSWQMFI